MNHCRLSPLNVLTVECTMDSISIFILDFCFYSELCSYKNNVALFFAQVNFTKLHMLVFLVHTTVINATKLYL